ncbi:hypothetical protein J6590_071002 [Homalodisca vitripennis]|nr:hypothetical protein J6590_071002 [Homalodisca vitripennis]
MDLDAMLKELGQFGKFQTVYFTMLLFPVLLCGFQSTEYIFTTMNIPHSQPSISSLPCTSLTVNRVYLHYHEHPSQVGLLIWGRIGWLGQNLSDSKSVGVASWVTCGRSQRFGTVRVSNPD